MKALYVLFYRTKLGQTSDQTLLVVIAKRKRVLSIESRNRAYLFLTALAVYVFATVVQVPAFRATLGFFLLTRIGSKSICIELSRSASLS